MTALNPGRNESPASLRRLGRNTLVYGIGVIASRIVSVIMLPVYTRYLVPAQYGLLQLLDMTFEIVAIVFRAGSASGLQRFFFKAPADEQRRQVAFTAFLLNTAGSLIGGLALLAASGLVHRAVLRGEGTADLVRITALNFFLSGFLIVPQLVLQIEQRAAAAVAVQLGKLAIQVTLNVYFLVHLGLGVAAMLWSTMISSITAGAVLTVMMLVRTGARGNRAAARDLWRFGVPYQVTTAASFILVFGDRFFLQYYRGAAEVGLYALAYQFSFLLQGITAGPFLRAWDPQRFAMVPAPRAERDAESARGFLFFNLLLVTVAFGITVLARPVLTVLAAPAYHPATVLVPVILLGGILQSWGAVVKFGIDVSEKTWLMTRAAWIATALIVVLYFALIPPYGGMGAAVATVLGYGARFGLVLHLSERVWPVRYGWRRTLTLAGVAVALALPSLALRPPTLVGQFGLGVLLAAAYGAGVWTLVLEPGHRAVLRTAIQSRSLMRLIRG